MTTYFKASQCVTGGEKMRASAFICLVGVFLTLVDQFYSGIDWMKLFLAGLVMVVVVTECKRWFRYKLKYR